METYNSFIYSISKYPIIELDEIIAADQVGFILNDIGSNLERIIQICVNLRVLASDFLNKLPLATKGPQAEIGNDYNQLRSINPLLQNRILKHDEIFPSMRCAPHFNKIVELINDIGQYIPLLISNQSSSINQYLDGIISSIVSIIDLYDKIIESVKNCENEIRSNISPIPENEIQISHQIAASLTAFEELLIKLHFFALNKTVQSSEKYENLKEWIEKGEKLRQNLFETSITDENQIMNVSIDIISELSDLSNIISKMPQSISSSAEFSNVSVCLTDLIQILNQIESKIIVKNITQIVENISTLFSSDEPLDDLIKTAKEVIEKVGIQIKKDVFSFTSLFSVSSYLALSKCIEKCITNEINDREFICLCVASVVRLAARIFPDAKVGEEILVSLSQKVATITKSIFKECKELITKVSSIIDSNLEFINDSALCETNYFITTAKNVDDFDLNSDDFVSTQQNFFASFCALPTSLTKLASTCLNDNAKKNLNDYVKLIQTVGDRFSKWLNQFWLTVFSVVHIRSEMIVGALSFPITLLSNMDKHEDLKNIKSCLSKIEKINLSTPQILMGDIDEVNSLISIIFDISKSVDYYMACIGSNAQSQVFPLYKKSSDALSEIILDLPQFGLQLPTIGNVDNIDDFVCFMLAFTTCSLRLSTSVKTPSGDEDSFEMFQVISPSFMYVYFADYFISQFSQTPFILPPLIANLHVSMDIVVRSLTRIIMGKKEKEIEDKNPSLSDSFHSLTNATEMFLSAVCQLKQPSLAYDIPDDIQEIRRFESVVSSLHSASLKSFAEFILMTMKSSQSSDVRNLLKKWFDTTQIGTVSISKSGAAVKVEIKNLLNDSKADRSMFIKNFSSFSVSLAAKESSYNKSILPIVVDLHKNLVTKIFEFLQESKETNESLLNIFGFVSEITAILPISKLKEKKDRDEFICNNLKSVIVSLNSIRQKSDNSNELEDKLNVIESIENLYAFNKITNSNYDFDMKNLLDKTVKGELEGEFMDQNITAFSQILIPLIPSQFSLLDSIHDNDTICDSLYDKAEAFGDSVNAIMQFSKNLEGDEKKIRDSLNKMYISSSDASLLVMHSLRLNGLDKTPLCATFAICCCELIIGLRKFSETSFSITSKETEESCLPELRRINRKLSTQFDTFINIVEDQQRQKDDMTEYEQKKCELYLNAASTVIQVDRLISLAATSLVPEMYFDTRDQISSQIEKSLSHLQSSIEEVLSQTVGTNKEDYMSLFTHLQQESVSLLDCSKNLTFGPILVPLKLIQSCDQFVTFLKKITTTGQLLTDKIIIQPDPVAASHVPDEALLPVFPKEAPQASESFKLLDNSHKKIEEVLVEFKKVNDDELSKSDKLVESIQKLRDASDDFIDKSILMAVSTVNPLYQVEQQTSLHAFVNALNNVQSAMRSRLMRTKSFKSEMDDSIAAFESSVSKTMKLASSSSSSSSSKSNEDEDKDLDDVTRELNATAKVIEMISARLKEFETQVDMEVLNEGNKENEDVFDPSKASQIEDIQVAAGTLPAYLIAAAKPILASTAQILVRAKEVTSWLLKKFGKIENERGLINTAQNLSEAAELLLICAEILVEGKDQSAEFKAITAARIINAAVTDLQIHVLKKGGDNEGIIQKYIGIVRKYSNSVVLRGEAIVAEKLNQAYEKKPKAKNAFKRKLEQDNVVSKLRTNLEKEEKELKEFRHQQHRNYQSPLKEKKT